MAEVINGTAGNDRLTAVSDVQVKAGEGNDTVNVAGAQNVTIETGAGKDEIIFPYDGYDNPNVIFTDFDPQNDILNFPEWAFFYKNYYFRASVENGNLILKDGLDWYTLTFQGVTSTDQIKDTLVKKWDGYSGKLSGILFNTISDNSSNNTNQSTEKVTYLTNGDDEFTNHHSNVRIEALAGNDSIENWEDYGKVYATTSYDVTINGGDGKDTIGNYQGARVSIYGGNGNDNVFNQGNYTTIDGGTDDDTIINNSNTSNCYIYGDSGKDHIRNHGSRIDIDAGDGNDTVYNTGNYVLVNSRAGNDSVKNTNQNVTIIGGKGDDSIDNSKGTYQPTNGHYVLFDYAMGDGNDIIWGFYHTSTLSISGGSYSSITSGNDVIIKVGDGSITLKDTNGTALNIIGTYDPNGSTGGDDTPTDGGGGDDTPISDDDNTPTTISTSSYDANTKTWTIYNGYDNEAIASDYDSEVKNVIATSRTKSIKITGNELDNLISSGSADDELYGEKGSDTIHGNGGKDTINGGSGNDLLYGDGGNDEIHGDDGNDELYGGDGNDILFGTDGKNTLNGGKNSDTMVGGKGEDVFVHGSSDGSDLILEYSFEQGDKLKFESELIEDVKIEGSDVIIATENGDKLTLKYAAGKEIAYINMRGNTETIDRNGNKPKSADSIYVKAIRLMNSATKTVDSTKSTAANTLYDSAKAEANFAVNELKKSMQIHTIKGGNLKKSDIPDSVYEKISEELLSAFNGSMIDHYEYGDMGSKLIKQIANQISSGFIDSISIVTDEKTRVSYTVSNSTYAMSGAMVTAIRISWSNKEVMLTWTNINKESGQIGFANYLKNLSDLNKEVWKDFVAAWLESVTGKNTRAALDFAEKVIEALCYKDDTKARALVKEIGEDYLDKLKNDLNERFTNSAQKLVRGFISKYIPNGDKILDAVDKIKAATSAYDELKEKYTGLVEAIKDYNDLANTGDFLALEKDYNTVENLYNKFNSAITDGINTDDTGDTILDKIFEGLNSVLGIFKANSAEQVVVTNTDSLDEITANRTSLLTFTENSGKGIQNADLRNSEYPQIISLEGGNQNVQFNDKTGNVAIVGENATGSKNIIFGNGDNLGIFYSPDANIRATVGSGRDSIITDNDARVRVDMTNSNETKIIPYSGRVILSNYNPDSRAEIILPEVTNITDAIKNNSIQLIGNEIRPNSSTRVQLNDSDDSNIVNLATENGDTQKVGFTGINGGDINAHKLRGNFLLKGNYAENASDKQKRKPSTLISGNGHDTILAGARDFVDGGNGKNQIFLTPYDLRQIKDGATIASSGNSRNTVHGFHEGFGYDGDVIQVDDFNNLKFKFDTDGLLLTADDSRIKFDGIGTASATTDDSTNSLGTDRAELIQITNSSSTMRAAVAQTNQSILVQEDDYITPNAFFGNRSGLNFSEYSGSVEINLADGTGKLGMWDATFQGINKLQAGNGMSTLIGDDTRNTLIAGTGYTSMWGGTGNDKLIGKGNSADKDGRTTFFFFAGDGRDVISDFTFLTPDNRYDGIDDRINVGDSDINDAYSAGNNVVVVFDQNSYLILEDAIGKDFRIANMIAKVDRNIAYDGLADCYVASGGSSLTVDSTVRSAEIWLDNSHGTQFFGNIRTLDASAMEGNTSLVGNEFDNTIIAGQGDSSLWGGFASSNDLLIGGNSRNTFFYCMGNGNDTIQGTHDKDFVILSDVSLNQIIETSITADSVSIRFNDGGSLQIQGTSDVIYQLADGSKYSANHQRLEWDSR